MTLKKEGDRCKKNMDSFVFNKKMICFEKNVKVIEISSLGVIKFKHVGGGYDLSELKHIDISHILTDIYDSKAEIYPNGDGSFYIIYLVSLFYVFYLFIWCLSFIKSLYLNQVTIDKNKKIIYSTKCTSKQFTNFKNMKTQLWLAIIPTVLYVR